MAGFADIGRLVATLGLNTTPFMASAKKAKFSMAELSKGMMMVGRTMTRFVTLPMAIAGGAAVRMQAKFEASMTKIIGLVGVSREQVEKWNKEVLKMAQSTGRGPEELADALYFVTSAGIRGAEALEVLEMSAKAAAAGLGETKVIADLVTSAMNAYGKENLSAAQATDILVASVREGKAEADELAGAMGMVLPIASEFGVSFDQVGAAFAGMTRTGTNARVAATQLKAILSAMASPSMMAADAMKQYGTSAEDFRKTVREDGLITAMLDLKTATGESGSAMSNIFPNIRALMGVLDLLGANVDYNVQIFESLKNSSGSLARAFAEVGGTTQQKLNVAIATLKSTLIELGELLKGKVIGILTWFNDTVKKLSTKIQLMTEAQKKFNGAIAMFAIVAGPALLILSKLLAIAATAIGPYVLAAAAVLALVWAIGKLVMNMKTASAIRRRSEKEQEKVIENTNKEKTSIEILFSRLKSLTKGTEQWNRVRDQINNKYGKYLTNLVSEKMADEELTKAQEELTKARINDLKVKGYQQEQDRVSAEYQGAIAKKLKNWKKLLKEGSEQLWDEQNLTEFDFGQEIDNLLLEGAQKMKAGASQGKAAKEMKDSMEALYKEFFGPLQGEEGGFELEGVDNLFNTNNYSRFADDFINAMGLQFAQIGRNEGLQEAIEKMMAVDGSGGENVAKKLAAINLQIQDTENDTTGLSKREKLLNLISLHGEKNKLVTGEIQDANTLIIDSLNEELRTHNKVLSSLSSIAKLEGQIDKLKDAQGMGSDAAQKANRKALAIAENKLEVLKNETSALNDQYKLAESIRINQEKLKTLTGEARDDAIKEVQQDQLSYALQEAKNSGLNKEQQLLMNIVAYKAYGLTLDEDSRKANDAIIEFLEEQARLEAVKYSNANKLGKLQQDLQKLEKDAAKQDGDKALKTIELIRLKEEEIAIEEEFRASLNEREKIANKIVRTQDAMKTMSGQEYKNAEKAVALGKIKKIQWDLQNTVMDDITRKQKEIEIIELRRAMVTNPALRKELAEQLKTLTEQKDLLQEIDDVNTGKTEPDAFSGEWFKQLRERMAALKELKAAGKDSSEGFKEAWQSTLESWAEGINHYVQLVGGILSSFTQGMAGLLEAQKSRELSAAGDNAKKREEIEKKYFGKQKKWAVAQAMINTALAIGSALTTKPFPVGLILAGVAAAAGGIQVAAVKAQSFAEGGVVYGETLARVGEYPGARTNPEVIAPLNKLKDLLGGNRRTGTPQLVELKIRGRDAYAMVNIEHLLQNTY